MKINTKYGTLLTLKKTTKIIFQKNHEIQKIFQSTRIQEKQQKPETMLEVPNPH